MRKLLKWGAILAIVGGTGAGAFFAIGYVSDLKDKIASQAIRVDEAIAAEEGFAAAEISNARERSDLLSGADLLNDQIERLNLRVSGLRVDVATARGVEIPVPFRVLVPVPGETVEIPADCIDCVETYLDSIPDFKFKIEAVDAILSASSGAVVASGEVALWRTQPEPVILLGREAWTSNEILISKPPTRYKRIGYFADIDYTFSPESVSATSYFDDDVSTLTATLDSVRFAAGGEVTLKGWTVRLGGHTDGGVRLGVSRHGRKRARP